jgi:DNA-binding NtrC family response regulator
MAQRVRALLVADVQHRGRLCLLLESAGVSSFAVASSCSQACRVLVNDSSIDLVVIAPRLVDGTWSDVHDQARQTGRRITFVICTALPPTRALRRAVRGGACHILPDASTEAEAKRVVAAAAA